MSLDSQKMKSDSFPAASSATAAVSNGASVAAGFAASDFVVYPAHGAGQILSIEEQTIAGASMDFFVIYFTKSKMTVRVPVRKAAGVGMRKLSDHAVVQEAKRILGEPGRKPRGNWPRLAQEYEGKINSGNIVAVAEVARDLFRPGESGQSFSERQLYASALDRLSGEIALVDGNGEAQTVKELEALLKTSTLKRSA
jgi:CarD family transcriptional regulator